MSRPLRPLAGCIVGISISESEEARAMGFPQDEVNRTVVRFVGAVLGQGAGVSFGHDWRDDGVMDAVHSYVERFRPLPDRPGDAPLLLNLIPWPDNFRLTPAERARLAATLRIEKAGLPTSLEGRNRPAGISRAYLRARALTHLRRKLTSVTTARVCIGGRAGTSQGRYPGIVEEALFAVLAQQPVYLVGLFGGATSQLISAIKGEIEPGRFAADDDKAKLYAAMAPREKRPRHRDDLTCSAAGAWRHFNRLGMSGLCKLNGLSARDNTKLFETQVLEEAIELILRGIARTKQQ